MTNSSARSAGKVTGQEIVELFRKAIRGEAATVALGESWNDVNSGNVRFRIGDYEVAIFNDCNELDYADSATAPDGRKGDFDDWWDTDTEPVRQLTEKEYEALEHLLESAQVEERAAGS
ncbi:MAG: hypothetical protein ACLQG3_02410 [Terracidiphilus sp.]